MRSALYTLDRRSITGIDRIDAQHRRLADLSESLEAACRGDDFAAADAAFRELAEALVEHFETEEQILSGYRRLPEMQKHLYRHQANHQIIRENLEAARQAFAVAAESGGGIPRLTLLVPKVYFEQMKDVDAEMAALLERYR